MGRDAVGSPQRAAAVIVFQEEPDPIFLALVHEAFEYVRDVHLVQYRSGYHPTRAERQELDRLYADLYPELARFFTRPHLIRVIDRLLQASRDPNRWYRITDYHWLVLYACLQMYCDLHNDGATGTGDKVGPYEIERIDFDALVDQFFFDTDFLMGQVLLEAEEKSPGQLHPTHEAWKIAAGLKPASQELRLRPVKKPEAQMVSEAARAIPASGYIGPYPLRQRDDAEAP